ncbi:MAG: conserved rane protein of unknown function, partial [Frankiales bacterium]|nr:conserved rane protein of unknown function [Frankiales bacterium]
MVRLARFVLRHKALVALFWLVVMLAGGATAGTTVDRLTVDFSLPGQQGYETETHLLALYGSGADEGTSIVALTGAGGPVARADVDAVFRGLQQRFPQYRVVWQGNTGSGDFVTDDGRTAYGLVVDQRFTGFTFQPAYKTARSFLDEQAAARDLQVRTTGYFELSEGDVGAEGATSSEPPSLFSETLLGAGGALVVLLFVFASFMALVPLVIAAVSILATFLCVLAVSFLTDVSFVVQFLIALVGLGVAIDYSLLVVTRWREEREHGRENTEAVVEAMRTAGGAVVSSAGTVAISLIALVVVPVPFLRSMGIGGLLIPVVSTLVVLTLLPVVLASVGPRVDWPRIRHENSASKAWSAWAAAISRRRWLAAGVGLVLLGLLVAPVFDIRVGQAQTGSLATRGPAVEALAALREGGVPAGVVTPLEVLVRGDDA